MSFFTGRLSEAVVVKIGGSTLGSRDTTLDDLVALQKKGVPTVVVHGGGEVITNWLARQGVATRFIRGLRVTDPESLAVATAVLAGLVNKELVSAVGARGGRAVGISGVDGRLMEARVRDPELGYVGQITRVNLELVSTLLDAGYIPLISPIAVFEETPEEGPSLLNINADTAAGELAAQMGARTLVFLTDVPGVMNEVGAMLHRLSREEAKAILENGTASGGMIPKIEACLRALDRVPSTRIVDGRVPGALADCLESADAGTTIHN